DAGTNELLQLRRDLGRRASDGVLASMALDLARVGCDADAAQVAERDRGGGAAGAAAGGGEELDLGGGVGRGGGGVGAPRRAGGRVGSTSRGGGRRRGG